MKQRKPTYAELLRDPRWQRKRLEIMQRDNFSCVECEDKSTTLNVHHGYYETGLKPWEYPDEALKTLCEPCHKARQDFDLEVQKQLSTFTFEELDCFNSSVLFYIHFFGLAGVEKWTLSEAYGKGPYTSYKEKLKIKSASKEEPVAHEEGMRLFKLMRESLK